MGGNYIQCKPLQRGTDCQVLELAVGLIWGALVCCAEVAEAAKVFNIAPELTQVKAKDSGDSKGTCSCSMTGFYY